MRALLLAGLLAVAAVAPAGAGAPQEISGERAHDTVTALTLAGPRIAGSSSEARAAGIVRRRLRALGYRVGTQRVRLPRGGASQNVIAVSAGRPRVVVAAHLDGVSDGPAANDNASGVAALLEVAAVLRGRPGVLFAALGAEERVETGSSVHLGAARLASGLRAGRRHIRAAIVLDMVGVGDRLAVRSLSSTPQPLARDVLNRARSLRQRPYYLPDRGLSDHRELTLAGIPSVWLQRRLDRCWHRPCDTADRLSRRHLADAARVTASAARAALRE